MAFINPLLARIFGRRKIPKEPAQKEETQAAPAPEAPKPRPELKFPPEHPLNQLRSMYTWKARGGSGLVFSLEAPEGREPIPEDEAGRELLRLQTVVNRAAKKRLELARPKPKNGEAPVTPNLDAQVLIFLPKNGLSAWLLALPPVGEGKPLDKAQLDDELDRAQVRFGLDQAVLDGLPKNPDRYFHLHPVAWGKAPVHGVDGRVVELFPRAVERKAAVDENNRDRKSVV